MLHATKSNLPTPNNVIRFQKRYGKPPQPFYPIQRVRIAPRLAEHHPKWEKVQRDRTALLAIRDELFFGSDRLKISLDRKKRAQKNVLNQLTIFRDMMAMETTHARRWHKENTRWKTSKFLNVG